jgi:hypothetical protein
VTIGITACSEKTLTEQSLAVAGEAEMLEAISEVSRCSGNQ